MRLARNVPHIHPGLRPVRGMAVPLKGTLAPSLGGSIGVTTDHDLDPVDQNLTFGDAV